MSIVSVEKAMIDSAVLDLFENVKPYEEPGQVVINFVSRLKCGKKFSMPFQEGDRGRYELWKKKEGVIGIQHFWKSTPTAPGGDDRLMEYRLGYDSETLRPKFFALLEHRILALHLGKLEFKCDVPRFIRMAGTGHMPLLNR